MAADNHHSGALSPSTNQSIQPPIQSNRSDNHNGFSSELLNQLSVLRNKIETDADLNRLSGMTTMRQWLAEEAFWLLKKDQLNHLLIEMIQLSQVLCDWPLLIYLYQGLKEVNKRLSAEQTLAYAEALWQHGYRAGASQIIDQKLLSEPDNMVLLDHRRYYRRLEQGGEHQYYFDSAIDESLYLASLEEKHLTAFLWQYNTKIAELCNLPLFKSEGHWLNWLNDDNKIANRHTFAVNHREWGFIGSVGLEVHNGIGFFHYWFGEDFQGQGFGLGSVKLLLDLGIKQLSMHCCFAKVYKTNEPSKKCLHKLGFTLLPFESQAPRDDEDFYYWDGLDLAANSGPNTSENYCPESEFWLFEDLRYLLSIVDSGIKLIPTSSVLLEAC